MEQYQSQSVERSLTSVLAIFLTVTMNRTPLQKQLMLIYPCQVSEAEGLSFQTCSTFHEDLRIGKLRQR
jgi:hypothetical protein